MDCEHCGTEIVEECKFCPQCGKSVSGEIASPPPVPPSETLKPRKKKWLLPLFWIVFVLLALLYWIGSSVILPQDIILGQLESIKNGKLTEAYYEYTSKEFQKSTSLDTFKSYVKENTVIGNVKSFIVEDEIEEGDHSTIRGFIISEDGTSIEAVYKLILEDGKWKIISFSPIVRGVKEEAPQTSITKQIIEPVQTFLKAISTPEFSEIYRTKVSKNFQENISYEQFQKFLAKNPQLEKFDDYEIMQHQLNRGFGELIIHLNPENDEIPIAFTVIKEDGNWKIFRISMGEPKEEEALKTKELFELELIPYVKSGLQLLKAEDLEQFYQHKTSAEFREDVDFSLLQEFYSGLPILKAYTDVTVKERGEAGEMAWMDVEIKQGSESEVIEFTLGKEQGDWKIWGIRIFEHTQH